MDKIVQFLTKTPRRGSEGVLRANGVEVRGSDLEAFQIADLALEARDFQEDRTQIDRVAANGGDAAEVLVRRDCELPDGLAGFIVLVHDGLDDSEDNDPEG